MTKITYPGMLTLRIVAQGVAQRAIASADEYNKVQAFFGLAFWLLSSFAEHPGLRRVQATAIYKMQDAHDLQLVQVDHHLKLTALGADLGLADPDALRELIAEIAPLPFLGEGVFHLESDSELVRGFVAAMTGEDEEAAEALVYRLATRLVQALGTLQVAHSLNNVNGF